MRAFSAFLHEINRLSTWKRFIKYVHKIKHIKARQVCPYSAHSVNYSGTTVELSVKLRVTYLLDSELVEERCVLEGRALNLEEVRAHHLNGGRGRCARQASFNLPYRRQKTVLPVDNIRYYPIIYKIVSYQDTTTIVRNFYNR